MTLAADHAPASSSEDTRSPHNIANAVLEECVRVVTGRNDLPPRTGQVRLMNDVLTEMMCTHDSEREVGGQALAEAPTGTGKSFSYLVPAMVVSALFGERTVVSTEMISLQTQIIDKDAPVVAAAVEKVTGVRPKVALMKGFSNYVCGHAAIEAAEETPGIVGSKSSGVAQLQDLRNQVAKRNRAKPTERLSLLHWALDQSAGAGTGDKNTYPGSMSDAYDWQAVSVSSTDCIGADRCSLADLCRPRAAREEAADADVIVTNHHLLAVQAAKDVPVVVGSKRLGNFDHIIIDEAHGLPSIVRDQGAVEVSGRTVKRAANAIFRVFGEDDKKAQGLFVDGEAIADRVEQELAEWAAQMKRNEDVVRLTEADVPLENTSQLVVDWAKSVGKLVAVARDSTSNQSLHLKANRVLNVLNALVTAVTEVGEHRPGAARWVELVRPHPKASDPREYPAARYTPVDVASMLNRNVWNAELVDDDGGDHEPENGPKPRLPLTVIALSATLPKGFGRQIGVKAATEHYESPFDDAYGASLLYVPRALRDSEDVDRLRKPFGGQPKFDTSRHAEWAIEHLLSLVEANGGSALVLSATATSGRKYAEALTIASRGRWQVLSQWDGPPLRAQVSAWKEDQSAVLVGTKSLMTGVDAPGSTCSLVIVDRPARARGNPVDDARVEMLMAAADIDKWSADRCIYVADASALLSQAAGRLIRTVSDSGMVAVLDPRLLKSGPFAYPAATRRDYLHALDRFETKIADLEHAKEWLRAHRGEVTVQERSA